MSIVLPTRWRPGVLGRMLQSILDQTFRDFELLVREDGAENDETTRVVSAFHDPRLRFERSEQRLGIPGVVNALLAETRGKSVMVLHDHDVCRPRYVQALVDALDRHPTAVYAHAAAEMLDQAGEVTSTFAPAFAELTAGRDWLGRLLEDMDCPVSACALVRRSAYETSGLLDPDFGFVADVDLWFRLALLGDVAWVPEVLIAYTEREADHEYRGVNWDFVIPVVRIHRKYEGAVGASLLQWLRRRRAVEQYLIGCFFAAVRDPKAQDADRAKARAALRRWGGVPSRLASLLR